MEVKFITDKHIWEKFITQYAPQSLFQSWNWGEVIKKSNNFKNKIWRLGIYDRNILIGIAQVIKLTAKRGIFLHVRHGPVLSSWNKECFNILLNHLVILGRKENAWFIRMSPLISNSSENLSLFENFGFKDAPIHRLDGELCWVLDLEMNENTLLSNMRKTTRYLIRQAKRMGVEIKKSRKLNDLESFIDLYHQTSRRHQFVPHTGLGEEFREFLKEDQIILFQGYYQKKLLAAALIIFYNHQAIYHHSASVEQKIPVNYLLQWEAIIEAKKRGMKIYNFWGVSPSESKRHPWKNLSLFKMGFGGRMQEYLHAKDYPLFSFYYITYLVEVFRKIYKGY